METLKIDHQMQMYDDWAGRICYKARAVCGDIISSASDQDHCGSDPVPKIRQRPFSCFGRKGKGSGSPDQCCYQ